MKLNINSPAYYTAQYGVIDEIYVMCKEISDFVRNNRYSDLIDIIGITPIIAPEEIINTGLFKEEIKCELKYGFAAVRLQINYEIFFKSDIMEKKKLIVENILKSVKAIAKRAKLDVEAFNKDIMLFCKQAQIDI